MPPLSLLPLYLQQDTLHSWPIGCGLTVPSHLFESLLVNVTGRLAPQQEICFAGVRTYSHGP